MKFMKNTFMKNKFMKNNEFCTEWKLLVIWLLRQNSQEKQRREDLF